MWVRAYVEFVGMRAGENGSSWLGEPPPFVVYPYGVNCWAGIIRVHL
jgi:hypothetical protein